MALYPIAKVMRDKKYKEGILFFNTDTFKSEYYKLKEIQSLKHGEKTFVGISCAHDVTRLYKYFSNIGMLGNEDGQPEKDSFTIVRKEIHKDKTCYVLVDTVGNVSRASKDELIQLVNDGTQIAGMEMQSKGRLLVSSLIETVIISKTE